MLTLFWVPVVAGDVLLWMALISWRRGRTRRSLAYRWLSVATVAGALCAFWAKRTPLIWGRSVVLTP
jgi:hypothetical protein